MEPFKRIVRDSLFELDPYDGLIPGELDLHGWGGHKEFFDWALDETFSPSNTGWLMGADRRPLHRYSDPGLVVEVGTWKGRSVNAMATHIRERNFPVEVVCVDTWLGAAEFWTDRHDRNRYLSLSLRNGFPQVYYTFLSNMLLKGHRDIVTPFPQTSLNAAEVFASLRLEVDLAYIDGSHSYEDVSADLKAWYPLLRDGGMLIGDDYTERWPGVVKAVDEFSERHDLRLDVSIIQRPEDPYPSKYWCLRQAGTVKSQPPGAVP